MRANQVDEFELMHRRAMLDTIIRHEGSMIRQHYTDLSHVRKDANIDIEREHARAVDELLAWQKYFEISLRNKYSCWEPHVAKRPKGDFFPLTRERWSNLLISSFSKNGTPIDHAISRMCVEFALNWMSGGLLDTWLDERDNLLQQISRSISTAIVMAKQGKGGSILPISSKPGLGSK